jgi:ankyrin repeat protein
MQALSSDSSPTSRIRAHLLDLGESGTVDQVAAAVPIFKQHLTGWAFETPLLAAARENRDPNVFALLLPLGFSLAARSTAGWAVLHELARRGWAGAIATAVRAGADVDFPTEQGSTPLMLATEKGQVDVVNVLLSLGADPLALTNEKRSVLHAANSLALDILIDAGAALDARSSTGHTPVHTAALRDNGAVCRGLAARGADLEVCCNKGHTPIFSAAMRGKLAAFAALLDAGARTDGCDGDGNALNFHFTSQPAVHAVWGSFLARKAMHGIVARQSFRGHAVNG